MTIKTLVYLAVILFALTLGAWALPFPGELGVRRQDVLFSLAASFVFVFMFAVNKLLGQNVLLNFVTGRYHKPRLEERILLFIDMEGSTGLAERLGPPPSTAWSNASSTTLRSRSSRRGAKSIGISAMS